MVIRLVILYWAFLLTLCSLDAAPIVDASIDSNPVQAHFPLQGSITITHKKEEIVDPHSFMVDGKSIDVSFVKDVIMTASSDTLISIYHFQLPGKEEGSYVLPPISVVVDGQSFRSDPYSYEVKKEGEIIPKEAAILKSSEPSIFRLEASVKGPTTLYPGERTTLFYRISYNRSVDLTRSELPMIHPAHFQKIGDVHIRDSQLSDVTVQDLTQEVEASELGTFSFGPSFIEGHAYTMEAGQKIYDDKLLRAEAPVITIEVKPFPLPAQPPSFTGGLGHIQVESTLTSSKQLLVGDTIQLQIKIEGISNLTELHLPSLQCQPGFSGFFQESDLPPLAEVKNQSKFFYVELRPLTTLVKQIPSIELSSFDLAAKKYVIKQTDAIPITVSRHAEENPSFSMLPFLSQFADENWPKPPPSSLEPLQEHINQTVMENTWLNSYRVLWLLPLGLLLLGLQFFWKKHLERFPKPPPLMSEKLFKQAIKDENLQLSEQAFWNRLWEKRKIPEGLMHWENLFKDHADAEVEDFIRQLQTWQYGQDQEIDFKQIKRKARDLFDTI